MTFFPELRNFDRIAIDSETTGLQYMADKAFGFSVSTPDGKDYYWDLREHPRAIDWFNDQMAIYKGKKIAHNASFDVIMMESAGIMIPLTNIEDTVIRAYCINEQLFSYKLDDLAKKYLNATKETKIYEQLAAIFGGKATANVQMKNISKAPPHITGPYAEKDTRLTLDLYDWQEDEIKSQGIERIVEFERNKIPMFIRNEMGGIRVDLDYAEEAFDKMTPIIDSDQLELNSMFGTEINVNSSPQVKKIFEPKQDKNGDWHASDGTLLGLTPKGNPSLGADALREMKHPGAKLILQLRSNIKTRDTFLKGHVIGSAVNGYVYPTVSQTKGETGGTGTGRLAYGKPAMQQIPNRNKKVAALIKPCFLPDEGHKWVDADMASFEVRVFAHLINNPVIINAYKENPYTDFHQFVADLTNLVRNAEYSGQPNAKQLNLSMIFNSGRGAIADKMGMPWEWDEFKDGKGKIIKYKRPGIEAIKVIDEYHRKIPGIKEFANRAKAVAENRGYVFTYTGRRLRFPRGYKSYKASGLIIQATSADLNKENWEIIDDVLNGTEGRMLLNTHDSYSMSLPVDKWEEYYTEVKNGIEKEDRIRVPLLLDFNGIGNNWWEALQNKGISTVGNKWKSSVKIGDKTITLGKFSKYKNALNAREEHEQES